MKGDSPEVTVVRRATSADLPSIGRLGELLVQQHHDFDARRFLAASNRTADRYASFLGSQINDPDVLLIVAESEANVIGYAYAAIEGYDWMSLRGPAAVLHDIVVDPRHRGRGIGRLLLSETLSCLQSRGAPRVVLSTAARNEPAQRLFERMGFRRTMVEMTRELDGGRRITEVPKMEITRTGSQPSAKGPDDWFTGSVRIDSPFQRNAPARIGGAIVTFEPAARTAWHTHPLGQTLIVTAGCGRAQREGGPIEEIRPGDIVWFAPGEKHWHGASPNTAMTHIAIAEALDGKVVEWMEKVSDEQYGR